MKFARWVAVVMALSIPSLSTALIPLAAADPPLQKATARPLPESVKYWVLFRHLNALEAKAAEVEKRGLDGSPFRTAIRDSAKLTDTQAAQLRSIATDCIARVEEKDREALKLIRAARAAVPGGKWRNEAPPEPPAELARLQSERDTLIDEARESLRSALGEKEFTHFQNFVDEKIAPTIRRQKVETVGASR